jgi:hypothetical protein
MKLPVSFYECAELRRSTSLRNHFTVLSLQIPNVLFEQVGKGPEFISRHGDELF